ncbi:retron Eco8 family effector endonuclease [Shewanella baltica]|uniref:retron Eco8 family effector endonuclease n=1 Tax=Shewanella baltica TaxID=62322 RepID=UPI003D79A686
MGIESIKIENILSFKDFYIKDIRDLNCVVGKNNVGKTNLVKVIDFYYDKLAGKRVLPLELNSQYSRVGSISLTYNLQRLRKVVTSNTDSKINTYQGHILTELFGHNDTVRNNDCTYNLTLYINSDGTIRWSVNNPKIHEIFKRIYPFFSLDMRRVDLHDWDDIWHDISRLKFINLKAIKKDEHINYINSKTSPKSDSYKDFVGKISEHVKTKDYSYEEKILNFIKVGLDGDVFNINGLSLETQSDGTNSYKYLELYINLLIALSRREFIEPTLYIDEPELGLHCKNNERFVFSIFETFQKYKKINNFKEIGRYSTPMPIIFISTHSPNITKQVIKLFKMEGEHQVLHLSKSNEDNTLVNKIETNYKDKRFYNIFSDNEARLLFSDFILFVEGETELEIFGNTNLIMNFPFLYDIDICKANEVAINGVAKSLGTGTIKYSILYDIDKVINVDVKKNTLVFKKNEVNLFDLYNKLKYATYNSKQYNSKQNIDYLLNFDLPKNAINKNQIEYDNFDLSNFVGNINKITTYNLNKMIVTTTIEGVLINKNSIKLFIRWIFSEIESLKINPDFTDDRGRQLINEYNKEKDLAKTFGKLHKKTDAIVATSEIKSFSKKIKKLYLKQLDRKIERFHLTEDQLAIVFRLAFDGKSDTLLNKKSILLHPNIKGILKIIQGDILRFFPYKLGKTHGWVTSFLDFSLIDIEAKASTEVDRSFTDIFKFTFSELYGILMKIKVDRI